MQEIRRSRHGRMVRAVSMLLIASFACATSCLALDNQDLSKLETKFFEHTYATDSSNDRLARLEKMVFGETRTGSDAERLSNLMQTTQGQDSDVPAAGAPSNS